MKQHKYTHLGIAPYRLVGYFYDAPVQDANGVWHGGQHSCDHCGRPISHVFEIQSSDGKSFNLGSVHVQDLGDDNLTKAVNAKVKEVKKEAQKAKREAINQKNYEQQQEVEKSYKQKVDEEFERTLPIMKTLPHPNAYFAKRGKTLYDYVDYFLTTGALKRHPKIISSILQAGGSL